MSLVQSASTIISRKISLKKNSTEQTTGQNTLISNLKPKIFKITDTGAERDSNLMAPTFH